VPILPNEEYQLINFSKESFKFVCVISKSYEQEAKRFNLREIIEDKGKGG